MPSSKFRVQLYLDPDIEQPLRDWIAERQFTSDSAALNQLLREYFNLEKGEMQALDWATVEAEVTRQLEPIKKWLAQLDDNYGTLLKQVVESPLLERIETIEAQMRMEQKSPQPGAYQEALETATYQQYVIEDLQQEIKKLNSKLLSDSLIDEQAEEEIEQLLGDVPPEPPNLDECVGRAIAIFDAQLDHLNKTELEKYSEEQLMDVIYITSPSLNVEQAEDVLQRVLERIPENPPLVAVLGTGEEDVELNLNEDSPSESPGELPGKIVDEEWLNHTELSQRLNTNKNTLRRQRNSEEFKSWSQQHDPYGFAWEYDPKAKSYRGVRVSSV